MAIFVSKKITDNVFGAVWLATLIMTYEEKVIKNNDKVFFEQVDIQQLAQKLCSKTVQSARISQWCNGDHPNNSYNYLRAMGSNRRLTQIEEFNKSKVYPERLLDANTQIFEIQNDGKKIKYGELFEWYCLSYSKISNLNDLDKECPSLNEINYRNDVVQHQSNQLQEDEIKNILENYLNDNGWKTQLAMGKVHEIDIDSYKGITIVFQ